MKRLFVAVDLDAPTRAAVAATSASLREEHLAPVIRGLRVSWVPPERLHITIEFLGSADDALERRAIAALAAIQVPAFDMALEGIGFFPVKGPPRVLWLGVTQGADELQRIHAIVRGRLGQAARPQETFRPHITLARFRDRARRRDARPPTLPRCPAGPCRIDRVTLYESRLSPRGPAYIPVAAAALLPCT